MQSEDKDYTRFSLFVIIMDSAGKIIDDYICNRKIEFKAKSEIMKSNRNYKDVEKKI